jgi:hypothetical protein
MFISYRPSNIRFAYLWNSLDSILDYHGYCVERKLAKKIISGDFWTVIPVTVPYDEVFGEIFEMQIMDFEHSRIELNMFTSLRKVEFMYPSKSIVVGIRQPNVEIVSHHVPANISRLEWTYPEDIKNVKLLFTPNGIKYRFRVNTVNLGEYQKGLHN